MNGKQPIRRYKRRSSGAATAVIIVLILIVLAAFACLIMAITGHLDPIIDSLFGAQGTEQVETGGETGEGEESGEESDAGTSDPGSDTQPPNSETSSTTQGGDPSVSDEWLSMEYSATVAGKLVVVNNNHAYTFPEEDDLINLYDYCRRNGASFIDFTGSDVWLNEEASQMLVRMLVDFAAETGKKDIMVRTAYRSYETQESMYTPGSTKAFKPGCTDYHTGDAVNLVVNKNGSPMQLANAGEPYNWIKENAHKYGFIMRYPSGKSEFTGPITDGEGHYRYVGVPHATAIYERSMCLEEYLEFLRGFTYMGNHLRVTTADGVWEIYSAVLSESGVTKIPVPTGDYTISGDNLGAVIICVPAGAA